MKNISGKKEEEKKHEYLGKNKERKIHKLGEKDFILGRGKRERRKKLCFWKIEKEKKKIRAKNKSNIFMEKEKKKIYLVITDIFTKETKNYLWEKEI